MKYVKSFTTLTLGGIIAMTEIAAAQTPNGIQAALKASDGTRAALKQ
jgi:hypothetical protein